MASRHVCSSDGVQLGVNVLGGSGPAMVIAHATGFASALYRPIARALGSAVRSVGFDTRGHGSSQTIPDMEVSWPRFAADVVEIVEALGLDHPIGFGHSAGASALLLAEARRPGTFRSIYCFEPIVVTDEIRAANPGHPDPDRIRARRSRFPSRDEARDHFASRGVLASFDAEVLELYVEHCLVERDGGLVLACPAEVEAEVYEMGFATGFENELTSVQCPVVIAVGATSVGLGPACVPACLEALAHSSLETVGEVGHLGPFERPDMVAASIITSIDISRT